MTDNNNPERIAEFKTRLLALLTEFDASIAWTCSACSDTHGIYEEAITVDMGNLEILRTETGTGYLDAHTMREALGDEK